MNVGGAFRICVERGAPFLGPGNLIEGEQFPAVPVCGIDGVVGNGAFPRPVLSAPHVVGGEDSSVVRVEAVELIIGMRPDDNVAIGVEHGGEPVEPLADVVEAALPQGLRGIALGGVERKGSRWGTR